MQNTKIYVGNIPYSTSEDDLRTHFDQFGIIEDLKIITDRETGRSRGFAFITYSSGSEAQQAIGFNGQTFQGKALTINLAKERSQGGGGRGGSRGGWNNRS